MYTSKFILYVCYKTSGLMLQCYIFSCILIFNLFYSSSASPESGLGTSHTSLPGSGQGSTNDQEYEVEQLQPLGTCKALYPFEGKKNF